jgi:hypothetical protein
VTLTDYIIQGVNAEAKRRNITIDTLIYELAYQLEVRVETIRNCLSSKYVISDILLYKFVKLVSNYKNNTPPPQDLLKELEDKVYVLKLKEAEAL